jgi:hypothetical protein
MPDFDKLRALELELINPQVRKNIKRIDELIADEFEEFSSSGKIFLKQDILRHISNESIVYELSDFSFRELSNECVLVKYCAFTEERKTLRSSIWVRYSDQWKMLHHQSTVMLYDIK